MGSISVIVARIRMTGEASAVEVTRGVFDPRKYKEEDKVNWARKRRSDWLASTGQIHFVRSRTVASEERELQQKQEEVAREEEEKAPTHVEEKPLKVETMVKKAPGSAATVWVGRKRSDVTRERYL